MDELDVGIRIEVLYGGTAAGSACLIDPQRRLLVLGVRRSQLQHGRCRWESAVIGLYEDRGREFLLLFTSSLGPVSPEPPAA